MSHIIITMMHDILGLEICLHHCQSIMTLSMITVAIQFDYLWPHIMSLPLTLPLPVNLKDKVVELKPPAPRLYLNWHTHNQYASTLIINCAFSALLYFPTLSQHHQNIYNHYCCIKFQPSNQVGFPPPWQSISIIYSRNGPANCSIVIVYGSRRWCQPDTSCLDFSICHRRIWHICGVKF